MAAPRHTVVVVLNLSVVLSFKCRAAPPQTSPPSFSASPPSFSASSPLFLALPLLSIAVLSSRNTAEMREKPKAYRPIFENLR
ncbi:hypothetical protein Nepgr_022265 [Nepenthes gracilis]|uniref:Secreted protein n=1 Tax=Nepenthes gracilis TaxID=150966 RepID=A0AAD3T0E9_NEPGR|nr:hypothetical protein Nepgr_022265 [Nepenthes gracilis]